MQGAVQVRAPKAAAPQACTAQAAVRTRLPARPPARRQGSGRRGRAGHARVTRGPPRSSRPAAPTWAAAGFRHSSAIAAPRRSYPREAQRCGLRSLRELRPLFPRSAPAPRRATMRPSPALRLLGTRSPPPNREKCGRGSDQPANQPHSRRQGARPNLRAAAELSFSSQVLVSLTFSSKVSLS